VPLRRWLARTVTTILVIFTALVSVGLTAPADGPFSIVITPVFVRLDGAAIAESRARALGFDVDIKIGSLRMHMGWSAVPISNLTTNTPPDLL
jgi:hypothetical protein